MPRNDGHPLRKLVFTIRNLGEISRHHYGSGPLSLAKMVYYSALSVNTFVLFERKLDGPSTSASLAPDFRLVRPGAEELEAIRQRGQLPREFYYDRLHGVSRCYVVMHGEEPAYIHWIYVKGNANRFLRLGEGVAEVNYITTLPQFRGRGLMATMMTITAQDLREEGFAKLVSVVSALNPPALRSLGTAGFTAVRKIRTLGYWSRKYSVDA